MKKQLLTLAALVALIGTVHAQQINGGLTVNPVGAGAFTSSSLTLSATEVITDSTGDLSSADLFSLVPTYSGTLTGLSSTPTPESLANYFQFSAPYGGTGTTPPDRFSFELTSLTETDGVNGTFQGSGILTDNTGAFAATPASFTVGFSSATNYSFSFDTEPGAVPEPSSWALAALVCGALVALRLRRRSEVLS